MTGDGNLAPGHTPWFGRTVIRSCAKLDYPTAQRMVEGLIPSVPSDDSDDPDSHIKCLSEELWEHSRRPKVSQGRQFQEAWKVARDVCLLHRVAMPRRQRRMGNGALVLNQPKLTFRLDSDGNPISTASYIIRESNQLIEEYMLLANYLVAEKLLETVGPYSFLRHHPPPNMQGLDTLVDLVSHIGLEIDTSSAHTLQMSLKRISERADPLLIQVITILIMHPMNRAQYFVVGETEAPNWRHYALSIPYYTHFTSPIRRYADVMVHRLLEEGLSGCELSRSGNVQEKRLQDMVEIAAHCNTRKDAAKAAQQRSDVVFLAVYLHHRPEVTEGVVIGIGEKSFTVLVSKYSFEERVFIDKMDDVEAQYNEQDKRLTLYRGTSKRHDNCIHEFSLLHISLLTKVRIRLSANTKPPISVRVEFIGPVL